MFSVWHNLWPAKQACYLALNAPQLRMRRQLTFRAHQHCLGRRQQQVSSLPKCSVTCRLLPAQTSPPQQHHIFFLTWR